MDAAQWIDAYLHEDIGSGDITSNSIFDADHQGAARMVARRACFAAGVQRAAEVFAATGATATVHADGQRVDAGTVVLSVSGPTRAILAGERLALNMVGRMSGIATMTRGLVEALADACCAARIAATRKTTPGFRLFEKEAVVAAGGEPHRTGLWDEAMIKDNHREAAGGIGPAVAAVRAAHPDKVISAEAESLEDARAAAQAGADWILIDNQEPATGEAWAKALWAEHPAVKVEASGGITPENVTAYGWADRISLGALTHQARSIDFGLDWGAP